MTGPLVVGCLAVLALGLLLSAVRALRFAALDKADTRRVDALYQAAVTGDKARLRSELDGGVSVDLQDPEGNSALHFACYTGREEAIAGLRAFGADDSLRNDEGLTPADMAAVAHIEDLLEHCAQCLDHHGAWADEESGRVLYRRLRSVRPHLYNPALVRLALDPNHRRRLLHLAVKLGVRGSEEKLGEVLAGYGTLEMANCFLNAGSPELQYAAERWAARNNCRIVRYGPAGSTVRWGRF